MTSCEELVLMSILLGNDNTWMFAQELQYHLKLTSDPNRSAHVTVIAKYIKKNLITSKNILRFRPIQNFAVNF